MADLRTGEPQVQGPVAHDAAFTVGNVNPLLIGGRIWDNIPAPVSTDGDASHALFDRWGRLAIKLDPDTENDVRVGAFGGLETGERNLVMSDFLGDSIETTRWTVTNANGGTSASSVGEGLLSTSANANGSTQMTSIERVRYTPGISYCWGCEMRVGNSIANNTKRIGVFTVSGTTPQDGYYFEFTGATPTVNIVSVKAGSATTVASGSWGRNGENPYNHDSNLHTFEIIFANNNVFFLIDGIVRHALRGINVAVSRVTTVILPITFQNINASAAATDVTMAITSTWVAKMGDLQDYELPHVVQTKTAQYTTTQTGTALWTPATGKVIVVTYFLIDAAGTTAGDVQLWFGASGDTTYTRGTDKAIFDGGFKPSSTLRPGVVDTAPSHGWRGAADDVLRVTDSAAINPLNVTVWGYEI